MSTRQTWVNEYVAMATALQKRTAAQPDKWRVRRMKDGWRIEGPDGGSTMLHLTYSDTRAENNTRADLARIGFFDDWIALEEERAKAKAERLEAQRKAAEARAQHLAAQVTSVKRAAGPYLTEPDPPDTEWALTPHPAPWMRWMLITPDLAEALLERNTGNRPIYNANVNGWTEVMEAGGWRVSHQGVAMDRNAVLQDGQHRLKSIVRSGVSVVMPIFVGMDPENFTVIDGGKTRSGGDALARFTTGNLAQKNSMVRLIHTAIHLGRSARTKPSNLEVIEIWQSDPDRLQRALTLGLRIGRKSDLIYSAAAAAAYLIFRLHDDNDERVEEFFDGLAYTLDERSSDPRALLQSYMRDRARKHNGTSVPNHAQLALILDTWNLWAQNDTSRKALRWVKGRDIPRPVQLAPIAAEAPAEPVLLAAA